MLNKEFHVKKSSGAFIAKGMFSLLMFLLSVCCFLLPKIYDMDTQYVPYIIGTGYLGSAYFVFIFISIIIKALKPGNALVLTLIGVYDFINCPGKGLFIDWENISSVKIFGSQKNPLLGIELYDNEIFIDSIKKSVGDEIRSNVEAGLPAIVIKQSEVLPKLSQILPAFNDFILLTRPISIIKNPSANDYSSNTNNTSNNIVVDNNTANNNTTDNNSNDFTKDNPIIAPSTINQIQPQPVKKNFKSIKEARKEMEEIFILPVESDMGYYIKPSKNNTNIKKDFSSYIKDEIDNDIPIPAFSEFIIDHKSFSKTDDMQVSSSKVHTDTKEISIINTKSSINAESNKSNEINTLDDLLSKFSIPIIKTNKKND